MRQMPGQYGTPGFSQRGARCAGPLDLVVGAGMTDKPRMCYFNPLGGCSLDWCKEHHRAETSCLLRDLTLPMSSNRKSWHRGKWKTGAISFRRKEAMTDKPRAASHQHEGATPASDKPKQRYWVDKTEDGTYCGYLYTTPPLRGYVDELRDEDWNCVQVEITEVKE